MQSKDKKCAKYIRWDFRKRKVPFSH